MIYDLAVIGAGSAGLSVAAAAAQFGQSVVLFEKSEMGGECLNTGCIPSKALLAAAKAAHAHRSSASLGIAAHEPAVSFAKVMEHVERVIASIAPQDSQSRFEGLGVKVVRATAHFTGRSVLEANGERFEARRIVIATGSRALVPAITGLVDVAYFTNETIFKNRTLPGHLIIIGAGPVGLELAQGFRRLGSDVTVLDAALCLAKDDPELVAVVLEQLRSEGIAIHTNVSIRSLGNPAAGIEVQLQDGQKISGTHLLVAAGRSPKLEGLNLDAAGIEHDTQGIRIDRSLRSLSNRNVYVAGDAADGLQLTHVANYHAGLIIRNALFRLPVRNRTDIIPWVTFTDPELAHVGLSEAEARAAHGEKIKVLRWSFGENDRAVAEGTPEGLVKIIALKNGRILGASIVGANAGEQIALWSLAVSRKLKMSAIASLVLPYPTLGEAGKRAAVSYYAGLPRKPWLRKLIGILKIFG
jgi:pyruvate/2-oxoglutarate dehydrogenase complex dihydrolipoamide dehydrogenase (E3) component